MVFGWGDGAGFTKRPRSLVIFGIMFLLRMFKPSIYSNYSSDLWLVQSSPGYGDCGTLIEFARLPA